MRYTILIIVSCVLLGCGSESPTEPDSELTGTWNRDTPLIVGESGESRIIGLVFKKDGVFHWAVENFDPSGSWVPATPFEGEWTVETGDLCISFDEFFGGDEEFCDSYSVSGNQLMWDGIQYTKTE